jgi:ribonuclease R
VHSIVSFERNDAHRLIEEFMIAANEAVGSFLEEEDIPGLFRIHPKPPADSLTGLRKKLSLFDISLPVTKRVSAKDLQAVLNRVQVKPWGKYIILQVLRSQSLAVYSNDNLGHFGLAKKSYVHFTSPIRRYPDLVVHRILKNALLVKKQKHLPLRTIGRSCSEKERNADDAERDLLEWRIYRFLKHKLGESVKGIIVDIFKAGLIVELEDYFVDGIIPFESMDGDYYYKKTEKMLIGKGSGKSFELGEKVEVILASVDPILRRISLALGKAEHNEG